MDSITEKLVTFTAGVDTEALPERAVQEVRRRIIDAMGCALVGMDSPTARTLLELTDSRSVDGGSLVWGTGTRTTPEIAALINATAVRFLDFNDHMLGGHPSDNIAAVVAACESSGGGVDDLIAGVAVNYEIFGELGRLLVRDSGWDQGTTGVIASACAAGRALGLTEDELANAIGIAATSNISVRKARRGQLSMWKGVATPYAAQCGLLAAFIAKAGMTGPQDPFEGENGFWQQIYGPFEIQGLADPKDPTYIFKANYKYWPVEFNGQTAVWLGKAIHEQVDAAAIESVEVETYYWTWHEIGKEPEKWAPKTRETADHSLPYAMGVSILHGGLGLEHFSDTALADQACLEMMSRITVKPADDITAAFPEKYSMRAAVTTKDGVRREFSTGEPRGRHTNPMTDEELRDKFMKLAGQSRFADRGAKVYEAVNKMGTSSSLDPILEALAIDAKA